MRPRRLGLVHGDFDARERRILFEEMRRDFLRCRLDEILRLSLDNIAHVLEHLGIIDAPAEVVRAPRFGEVKAEHGVDDEFLPLLPLFGKAAVIAEELHARKLNPVHASRPPR